MHHGIVKLAGRVDDVATREGAERAAAEVDEVTAVVMDIDVAAVGAVVARRVV